MKRIILIRHSKATPLGQGQTDFSRSLKPRGHTDARLIADYLTSKEIRPQLIVSSPAQRANQTARIIASVMEYPLDAIRHEHFIYEGYTSGEFISYINRQDDALDTILVVGHNPEIAMLSINLTNGNFFHFPTTATVVVRFNCNTWQEVQSREGTTELFTYPEELRGSED